MEPTSILDLRDDGPSISRLVNMEAEQALLGILLYENEAFHDVPQVTADHFYEKFHGRLFAAIASCIASGKLAEPILIYAQFAEDPGLKEMRGLPYLADLVEHAPPPKFIGDYAATVVDLANRRAALALAETAARDLRGAEETKDAIEALESGLFALAEQRSPKQGLRTFSSSLDRAMATASDAYSRDGGLSGISAGLVDVDRRLGGFQPSDLIILASRPSMGKTSLGTNIAMNAARRGEAVAYFSPEMSDEQLTLRILADIAGVSSDLIRRGDINDLEYRRLRDAEKTVREIPLFIDDTGSVSLANLSARARRQKRKTGLSMVVVDYLQLVTTGARSWSDNRVQEVSQISAGLKALAKELNVPVIALSQLSRKVEDRDNKRPQLADLRESGSIEQDADVVLFLYREAYYLQRSEPDQADARFNDWQMKMADQRHVAELIIGKQRHGPIGTVKLHFDEDFTRFSNAARERDEAPSSGRYAYGGARD